MITVAEAEEIHKILIENFCPVYLEVTDESHEHASHAGVKKAGGGHYTITLASTFFKGKERLERHRMIYAALEAELKTEIHALRIYALSPDEWGKNKNNSAPLGRNMINKINSRINQ